MRAGCWFGVNGKERGVCPTRHEEKYKGCAKLQQAVEHTHLTGTRPAFAIASTRYRRSHGANAEDSFGHNATGGRTGGMTRGVRRQEQQQLKKNDAANSLQRVAHLQIHTVLSIIFDATAAGRPSNGCARRPCATVKRAKRPVWFRSLPLQPVGPKRGCCP